MVLPKFTFVLLCSPFVSHYRVGVCFGILDETEASSEENFAISLGGVQMYLWLASLCHLPRILMYTSGMFTLAAVVAAPMQKQ